MFEHAKWIWTGNEVKDNDYAEFREEIFYGKGNVNITFSVSGDYALFINGKYVKSVQYSDFSHYKVYEKIDVTSYLKAEKNTICFLCLFQRKSSQRNSTPFAGLIFEINNDGKVLAFSCEKTPSRTSRAYLCGYKMKISNQLGYSFLYSAEKEDAWLTEKADGFGTSSVIEQSCNFVPRPIDSPVIEPLRRGAVCDNDKNIFDLGDEYVGFCSFCIKSKKPQTIRICYGELLKEGHVRKKAGKNNFYFEYHAKAGENIFTNYILRLAARYIEVEYEDEISVDYIGILPEVYQVKDNNYDFLTGLDKEIYKICLNTLHLCMMEHYVDCPWREQCLYTFDSRNQMLAGYYAFEGGNLEYARANLLLMSKDKRDDGLLSICFPSDEELVIPSYCFYYILEVVEYMRQSGDLNLGEEIFDKMTSVLNAMLTNRKNGLMCSFPGEVYWNFFDWSEYAQGSRINNTGNDPNCLINATAVLALKAFEEICDMLGKENIFSGIAEELKANTNKSFYNEETGLYFISSPEEKPTELVNSLCIVAGIADKQNAEKIAQKLVSGDLINCSLCMKVFKYDALLSVDEKYKDNILSEIRSTYKIMLDAGSTTVWETIDGVGGSSLCHGWSSIPIYYYHKYFS